MAITWKINGRAVSDLGFVGLALRLVNQVVDTLRFTDAGTFSAQSYTAAPAVTISGGGGTGATGTTTVDGGVVDSITLTDPGSGYTSTPSVELSGAGSATAQAALTPTTIASLSLTNAGGGYTSPPTVAIAGGGGTGATATAELPARAVGSIAVTNGGSGYTSAPTVALTGGGGTGATAVAVLSGGAVVSVAIGAGGTGYTSVPTISFTGGGGTGAAATASLASRGVSSVAVTAAGSYPLATSTFSAGYDQPAGLAFDASGNLFIADVAAGKIFKVTTGGTVSEFATTYQPEGFAFDGSGNLWVANFGSFNISKFTPAGAETVYLSAGDAASLAYFGGYLYSADYSAGTVSKINPADGSYTTFASGFSSPIGLAFDTAGNCYVAQWGGTTIKMITPVGTVSTFASGISGATDLAFDANGDLFVSCWGVGGVVKVTPAGVVSTYATGLSQPFAIRFNAGGHMFVAHVTGGTVTKLIGTVPTVTLVGGGGTGATARANMVGPDTFTIASIDVVAAGTGYTSAPSVVVSGGGGSGGAGTATLTPAAVSAIAVTAGGTGYTSAPTVGITGGGGSGASATASVAQTVSSLTLTAPGSGYTSAPSVGFSGGGGTGAAAAATLVAAAISGLTLTAAGSGFTSTPTVSFSGGGGTGGAALAVLTPTTIGSLILTHGGGAYPIDTLIVLSRVDGSTDPVTWFRGHVRRPPRRLTPEEEIVSYEVEGPWQWLERTPYLQNYKTPDDPEDTESALVDYLRGRAVLAQADDGSKVSAQEFLTSVIDYCAAAVLTAKGFSPFTADVAASLDILIPWDEVNDLSCADVISRVLTLLPDAVCWFDYAVNPPVLHIDRRQLLPPLIVPVVPPGGGDEFAVATRNAIELAPLPKHQKTGVVLIYISTHRSNEAAFETYVLDRFPPTAIPNDPDVLVRTIQLAGGIAQGNVLTQKVDVDPIPSQLVIGSTPITSGGTFDTVKAWWRKHAPELLPANVTVKAFVSGTQLLTDGSAVSGDCPNELVKGGVTDWMEDVHEVLVEDQVIKVDVILEVTDPLDSSRKERVRKQLSAQIKATNATTKTYTFTASSSFTPPEPVPAGLAAAIYEAISPLHYEGAVALIEREATVNSLIGRALNLTGDVAAWETMNALVQEAVIDIDSGTTRLAVGPPRHLGVGELIDLFRVNRTRPQATSWETRTTGRSGSGANQQGLSRHHPQTKVSAAQPVQPRVFTASLSMAGTVPTQIEVSAAIASVFDATNMPLANDVVHLTVSGVPKLSYRMTLTALTTNNLNVVPVVVDGISFRAWLAQMGLF